MLYVQTNEIASSSSLGNPVSLLQHGLWSAEVKKDTVGMATKKQLWGSKLIQPF